MLFIYLWLGNKIFIRNVNRILHWWGYAWIYVVIDFTTDGSVFWVCCWTCWIKQIIKLGEGDDYREGRYKNNKYVYYDLKIGIFLRRTWAIQRFISVTNTNIPIHILKLFVVGVEVGIWGYTDAGSKILRLSERAPFVLLTITVKANKRHFMKANDPGHQTAHGPGMMSTQSCNLFGPSIHKTYATCMLSTEDNLKLPSIVICMLSTISLQAMVN